MTVNRFKALALRETRLADFVRAECAGHGPDGCRRGGACPLTRAAARGGCQYFEMALLPLAEREGMDRVIADYERARRAALLHANMEMQEMLF